MHYAIALAGLAAMAAAAPIDTTAGGSYGNYNPYKSYGIYAATTEAEAAKMQMGKTSLNMSYTTRALREVQMPPTQSVTQA